LAEGLEVMGDAGGELAAGLRFAAGFRPDGRIARAMARLDMNLRLNNPAGPFLICEQDDPAMA
jgi:hypothetical protein